MKTVLVYRASFFMWLIISIIDVGFIIFLYQAIYNSYPVVDPNQPVIINGFQFNEMIIYMITSFMLSFCAFNNDTTWTIFEDIREGTIANTLTKPVSYRLRHLFTCIGSAGTSILFIFLPFMIILYGIFIGIGWLTVTWTFIFDIILFLGLTFLAIVINDSISYFVGLMTFFTEHMFGLNMFKQTITSFLSGQLLPLSYMGSFGIFCSYTPFAFMNSTPVLMIMGKIGVVDGVIYFFIALGWVILLELVNHLIFKRCLVRVTVQGG